MFHRIIMSLGLAFLAQPALAQSQAEDCGARGPDIIAAIHPQATQLEPLRYEIDGKIATLASIVGGPYDMICRDWPAYPDRLLVGLPLIHGADAADDPDKTGDLEILVLDRASYAPQARLLLSDFIQDDAIYLSSLVFDTAVWRLFDDRIAFGLRREVVGSSRPNPFGETGLWLFDVNGDTIRPVLEGLQVRESHGEWDTTCAGEFVTTTATLDIGPQGPNGAPDLIVTGNVETSVNRAEAGGCVSTKTDQPKPAVTLQYDGTHYPVPADLLDISLRY